MPVSLEFRRVLFFYQAEDGIRDLCVTGVQTCALLISSRRRHTRSLCDWSSDVCSSDLFFVAAYQCNAGLPPATPKGGRAPPHFLCAGHCAASKRPLPPHPRRLLAAERSAGRPAKHGDSECYRLCLILRDRVVGAGSASRRPLFLP